MEEGRFLVRAQEVSEDVAVLSHLETPTPTWAALASAY
jgi:hypothetical protein